MGNFDKIMRENLGTISKGLLKCLLRVDVEEIIAMPPRVRKTILEKETDNLFLIKPLNGLKFILHLEFQSTNDIKMPLRVAVYNYAASYMYKKRVLSIVIYVGKPKLIMKNVISSHGNHFEFILIDIRELDPRLFLESPIPKELILAVLAGNDEQRRNLLVNDIFDKLRSLTNSESELSERLQELEIISILRGEDIQQSVINLKDTMPIIIDIRKDLRFKQARKEGKEEMQLTAAERMLRDGVHPALVCKYTGLPLDEVQKLANKIKDKGIN